MSHAGFLVLFTNTGSTSCVLQGYPVVSGVDARGRKTTQAKSAPAGYLGGLRNQKASPPRVLLHPGQQASALVEGYFPPKTAPCTKQVATTIRPPGAARTTTLTLGLGTYCGAYTVQPVVPGVTGNYPAT